MIIYGSNASHLRTAPVSGDVACANCGTSDSLKVSVFGRYAHVYWIPLVPFGKTGASECGHCQQVLKPDQMPVSLQQQYKALKASVRAPLWHFAGLAALVLLIGWFMVDAANNKRADAALLAAPKTGDIYQVKTDDGNYSLLKVTEVGGNGVSLVYNEFQVDNIRNTDELNKPENFKGEPFRLTQLDLRIMHEKGDLLDVQRP